MDLNASYLLDIYKQRYAEIEYELFLQTALNKQLLDKIKELEDTIKELKEN